MARDDPAAASSSGQYSSVEVDWTEVVLGSDAGRFKQNAWHFGGQMTAQLGMARTVQALMH